MVCETRELKKAGDQMITITQKTDEHRKNYHYKFMYRILLKMIKCRTHFLYNHSHNFLWQGREREEEAISSLIITVKKIVHIIIIICEAHKYLNQQK